MASTSDLWGTQMTYEASLQASLSLPHLSSQTPSVKSMAVGDSMISSSYSATCLGVTWSHDLSPSVSISNHLAKAR